MINGCRIASDTEMVPRVPGLNGVASEVAAVETAAPSDRRLVLLMSDDPLMSRALSRLLRKAGYEVVACDGGYGGKGPDGVLPALVIVDVPDDRMPRVVTQECRSTGRPDAPSVLWIGDSNAGERRRDDHLAKPFTGNQLLAKVASLLTN